MIADLQKIAVKFFVEDPAVVRLREIVPIFHRWIQKHTVPGILVDVADYGHLPTGPGVVLVGHEADYFMDSTEGPLGLLYSRKEALEGAPADRIRACFRAALHACAKLQAEPEFEDLLRFKAGEARLIANDRLVAPNTEAAFAELRPDLEAALAAVYGGAEVRLARDTRDPRSRLTVLIKASAPGSMDDLLARLG